MNTASAEHALTWSTWRELVLVVTGARNLRRTVAIALCVGTVFFAMNQLGLVLAGRATTGVWVKGALTYLTPPVGLQLRRVVRDPPSEPDPRLKEGGVSA
jgi:hypothetical protein